MKITNTDQILINGFLNTHKYYKGCVIKHEKSIDITLFWTI